MWLFISHENLVFIFIIEREFLEILEKNYWDKLSHFVLGVNQ